jgi:hypothetical protein
VLRVVFVLRSTEVHPEFSDLCTNCYSHIKHRGLPWLGVCVSRWCHQHHPSSCLIIIHHPSPSIIIHHHPRIIIIHHFSSSLLFVVLFCECSLCVCVCVCVGVCVGVCVCVLMMNRDSWGHSYLTVRGEHIGFIKDGVLRKHLPIMLLLIKNES